MDTATDVTRYNDARIREYWEVFNTHDVAKGSTFSIRFTAVPAVVHDLLAAAA